jgi:hypothetical protein
MKIDQIYPSYLYEGLNLTETTSVKLWENAGRALKEAALTPDQIQQLFTSVEQSATAAGSNRTMIGKGKDAAGAVKKAYDDLVSKVQNSGPVKGVDAMYDQAAEKLKQATGGDQGVMQYVDKYREFAKAHPIAQSLIYSALIAAAGISGVGVGGAAALGLFKMVDKLLQGEKFSTAVGKGLATGATAYAAGQIGQSIKGGSTPDVTGPAASSSITSDMGYDQAFNTYIQKFAQDPKNPSAMIIQQAKQFAATKAKVSESINLSERQIATLFTLVQIKNRQFNEGMWDSIKNKAATFGKNLTTKITADKLNSAWTKAGSPTDSEAIAQIIQDAGVDPAVVSKSYTDMGIAAPVGKVEPTLDAPAAAAPASAPTNVAAIAGGAEGIKKWYQSASPEDRQSFKSEIEVIDDQDRLASGTNESVGFSRYLGMAI